MEISNFSSLFEILFTINLAYVITDQVIESNFISTMTDRVLLKYESVRNVLKKTDSNIVGVETSLNNLKTCEELEETLLNKHQEKSEFLKTTKKKYEQSKKEILSKIKDSYQTKAFSFLSLFLACYCLIIIIFGGVTSGLSNIKFDYFLFFFNFYSIIFMWFGWEYDSNGTIMPQSKKGKMHNFVGWVARALQMSGFVFTLGFVFFMSIIVLFSAILIPEIAIIKKREETLHDLLVIVSVLLPLSNFIAYFIKAGERADMIRDNLKQMIDKISEDVSSELLVVEHFVTTCNVVKKENLKITAK